MLTSQYGILPNVNCSDALISLVEIADEIVFDIPGEYILDKSIKINKPIFINGNGVTINYSGATDIFRVDASNVTIKGINSTAPRNFYLVRCQSGNFLTVQDCNANDMALVFLEENPLKKVNQNSKIINCKSTNAANNAIMVQYANNLLIDEVTISEGDFDGIKLSKVASNITIKNSTISSSADDLIDVFGGGSDVLIEGCTLNDGNLSIKSGNAYDYRPYIKNITVRNCKFTNATIDTYAPYNGNNQNGLFNLLVENNTVENNKAWFIQNGSVQYKLINNTIRLYGFQMALNIRPAFGVCEIVNNFIYSDINTLVTDETKGVYMITTQTMSDPTFGIQYESGKMVIKGNTIVGGRRVIKLDGLTNFEITDNKAFGLKDHISYQELKPIQSVIRPQGWYWYQSNNIILK